MDKDELRPVYRRGAEMIKIKVVYKDVIDTDENGAQVAGRIGAPETPTPSNAVRVECDGAFYTVYEAAD